MQVEVTRSGGIAGLTQSRTLDTAALGADESSELEGLMAEVDLEELQRRSPIRGRGADRYQYDVLVKRQGKEHRVVVAEGEVPPKLATVLDRMFRP